MDLAHTYVPRRPLDTEYPEMVSTLRFHARWIQHLDCRDASMERIPDDLAFPCLRFLIMKDLSTYDSMLQIQRRGALLTRLHIQATERPPWYRSTPSEFWETIQVFCPMLVELTIQRVMVLDEDLSCAMALWSRLRTLRLLHVRLPRLDKAWSMIDAMKLEVKIQHLDLCAMLELSAEKQLGLMKRCPQLKSFSWTFHKAASIYGPGAMGLLANALVPEGNGSSSVDKGLGKDDRDDGEEGQGEETTKEDEDFSPIILPHLLDVEVSTNKHEEHEIERFLKTRARVPFQSPAFKSDFWKPWIPI